jgi:membrane protease YdiL (CAAX protease family)
MYDQDSKHISYMSGFFMLIAFVVGSSILAGMLSSVIWTQVTGQPFTGINDPDLQLRYATLLQILQGLTAVVGFLLPSILTAQLMNRRPMKLLGFTGPIQASQALIALAIAVSSVFVASGFAWVTTEIPFPASWVTSFDSMEKAYAEQAARVLQLDSVPGLMLSLLVMAFLPAVSEEALFRGGLQNFLARGTKKPWLGIVVASILFSLAHFSAYGFLSRVVLGIALGAIFQFSGRLWIGILIHFLNNAYIVVWLYFSKAQGENVEELLQKKTDWPLGLLAIPIFAALIVWYRKRNAADGQPV